MFNFDLVAAHMEIESYRTKSNGILFEHSAKILLKNARLHFSRWVFRIRFQNPVVFTFSESGCFFRFFSFFVLDLVVTGNRVS
jgi:hypothetical protein